MPQAIWFLLSLISCEPLQLEVFRQETFSVSQLKSKGGLGFWCESSGALNWPSLRIQADIIPYNSSWNKYLKYFTVIIFVVFSWCCFLLQTHLFIHYIVIVYICFIFTVGWAYEYCNEKSFCSLFQQTPAISLQIAASLPNNNYFNNAFRNSFFYQVNLDLFFLWKCNLRFSLCFSVKLSAIAQWCTGITGINKFMHWKIKSQVMHLKHDQYS